VGAKITSLWLRYMQLNLQLSKKSDSVLGGRHTIISPIGEHSLDQAYQDHETPSF
jgi:hypothetical protein